MQDLIGRCFSVEGKLYAISDTRNIGVDTMVYADAVDSRLTAGRAAFRYADIAPLLKSQAS